MNDSSPDRRVLVWLTSSDAVVDTSAPDWLEHHERQRMALLGPSGRRDFLASRWLIRHSLNHASGEAFSRCAPAAGRPVASHQPQGWAISVSHSRGVAGCAVSDQGAIGLDLEALDRNPDWRRVVRRWFCEDEQRWLLEEQGPDAFFTVWTLKEAWLKATGRGIANNLRSLRMTRDYQLVGDRAGQWYASVGQLRGFRLSVIREGSVGPPVGGLLQQANAQLSGPGAPIGEVDWLFHRRIEPHSCSEQTDGIDR